MSRRSIQDCRGTVTKYKKSSRDGILDLPELVISHILSLMPTKDAVKTSVLSRDWEYKWTSINDVDIDDKLCYTQQNQGFFRMKSTRVIVVNFVERVLFLSRNIRSFCLSLSSSLQYDTNRIAAWICAVLMGNVESLVVHYNHYHINLFLPRSLLHNTSLRNLELKLRCTFKVPARISFPNLKSLILYKVEIVNDSSTGDTLTLSFPLLETFTLEDCELSNVKMVEVHAPALTTFHRTFPGYVGIQADYSIKIISTRLVEFRFSGEVPEKFILIGQQVVYATLSYAGPGYIKQVLEAIRIHAQTLLSGFSNLKELNISGSLTEAIAQSTAGVSLPVLHHLVRLVVSCNTDVICAKGLLGLLHATPSLKFLKIDMCVYDDNEYDCNAVEHVPLCIQDQLVEIEFEGFDECALELNLVKFLLKNGRALRKVDVSFYDGLTKKYKRAVSKQLSSFPNSSTSLTFVVN